MDYDKKLTAFDYLNVPFITLLGHPDYSQPAMDVVWSFVHLSNEELEALDDIIGDL